MTLVKNGIPVGARTTVVVLKPELRAGDRERVQAGMELMGWTYDEAEWHWHAEACARRITHAASLVRRPSLKDLPDGSLADELGVLPPPTVLFTSTGMLFGDVARLWRAPTRLVRAEALLVNLVLTFGRTRLRFFLSQVHEIWVPVPKPLAVHVREMAQMLNEWVDGRSPNAGAFRAFGGHEPDRR